MSVISMPQIVGSTRKLVMLLEVPPGDHENGNFLHRWRQGRGQNKEHFGLSFQCDISNADKNWHSEGTWPCKQPFHGVFQNLISQEEVKYVKRQGGRASSKLPFLACHFNMTRPMRTKIGTMKLLDPGNKSNIKTVFFLKICKFDPTQRGQSSKFDLISFPKSRFGLLFGSRWSNVEKIAQ